MSKRIATVQAMIIIFSILIASGNVAGQSEGTVIDSDITWDGGDYDCDEALTISEGGTLTIRDSMVGIGCDITVEDGGVLNLENSVVECGLSGDSGNIGCPTGIMGYGYWDEESRASFKIPTEGIDGDFSVTMHSVGGASYYGGQAFIADSESISLNGTDHTFEFSSPSGDGIWIGLIGYGQSQVSVSRIVIETGSAQISIDGKDLESRNMMGSGEQEFEILVNGRMHLDSSSLIGIKVTVATNGALVSNSSVLDRVGPIIATSSGSSVQILGNSTFSDSLDDHDVRVGAQNEVVWGEEAEGSGGFTDRWERRLVDQKVIFDAEGVVFRINGVGVEGGSSFESFSDATGEGLVNGGGERVVQIGWSNGTVWSEEATVEILSYRTGWNPDGSGIDNYGGYSVPLGWSHEQVISENTPFIQWESLEADSEDGSENIVGVVGDSLEMRASFTNTGTAAASFYISCGIEETGLDADIGGFQGIVLGPGESNEILFGWRNGEIGELTLKCKVLTPTQLVSEDSFGGGEISSETVSWTESEDEESLPMVSILVAIVVTLVMIGSWLIRKGSEEGDDEGPEGSV